MIDVAHARENLNALPGEHVVNSKAQISELLAEVEIGQQARRALAQLKAAVSVAAIAANAAVAVA